MKDYNETITEILSKKVDEKTIKIIDRKKEETIKNREINIEKIKIMKKIAKHCWRETKKFLIDKYDDIEYRKEDYSVRIWSNSFCIWIRDNKIKTGYHDESNPILLHYNTSEISGTDIYVDLLHLDLVKKYFEEILFNLKNKTREELVNLEYENDKQKSFLKMIIEKVSNW